MPVGFNSPARNFFLLGSSGDGVVGNFFDTIDRSAGTDGVYLPDEIRYNYTDQKYLLAGSASDSASKGFGWFEKRDETGALEFDVRVEAGVGVTTTLRAMELDSNNNLIVAGFSGTAPWIAKYSNGGVIDWQSTTFSANVRYLGLTSDSNGNYYACGRTSYLLPDTQAFVEKFDSNGNPGWGKSAFMLGRDVVLKAIAANSRGEVVAVGFLEDDSADKGYIVKIDTTTGDVMWDRTLSPDAAGDQLKCTDVYIDNQDQIYVSVNGTNDGYLVKYTPEGNIQWQRKTGQSSGSITYDQVFSDGETQQTVVFGTYTDSGDTSGLLTKYSRNGDLVWRRTLTSSFNNSDTFGSVCLDGDPSFYYFMYIDGIIDGLNGTPDSYTFGKVSSSGNGLGAFQYTEGTGETIDYVILNEPDKIGRLSDGSVRHDTSDLIAYPFGATKIMFDDLAAKVTNKKRQMDAADSFEYSGSPAIRPADFQEMNLLGDVYSGSGDWLDQSGKGNDGVVTSATYNAAGYFEFDGVDDKIVIDSLSNFAPSEVTFEAWFKKPTGSGYKGLVDKGRDNYGAYTINVDETGSKATFTAKVSGVNGAVVCATAYGSNVWNHVVGTYDGTDLKIYLNGSLDGTTNIPGVLGSNTVPVTIGSTNDGLEYGGEIGEVRIYPKALTAAAVFQNYNATKSKYITEAPDTAPRIGPGIVNDSNLLLNYDFGNRATYDPLENLLQNSNLLQTTSTAIPTDWQGWNPATWLSMPHLNGPFGDKSAKVVAHGALNQNGGGTRKDVTGLVAGATYTVSAYVRKISEEELAYWNANNSLGLTTGTASGAQDVPWFAATACRWDLPNISGTGDTPAAQITLTDQWQRIERDFPASSDGNKRLILSNNVQDTGTGNEDGGGVFLIAAFQLERKYNTLFGGDNKAGLWFATGVGQPVPAPTTVKNLSTGSADGTITGAEFDTDGYFVFDGTDDHIDIDPVVSLSTTSGFTVCVWLKMTGLQSSTTWNYFIQDADGVNPVFESGIYNNNNYSFGWKDNSVGVQISTVLTQNQWHLICFGVNSSATLPFIYRDGIYAGGSSTAFNSGNFPIAHIMGRSNTSNNLGGHCGEVQAYNRELSGAEVLAHFNATRGKYGV